MRELLGKTGYDWSLFVLSAKSLDAWCSNVTNESKFEFKL